MILFLVVLIGRERFIVIAASGSAARHGRQPAVVVARSARSKSRAWMSTSSHLPAWSVASIERGLPCSGSSTTAISGSSAPAHQREPPGPSCYKILVYPRLASRHRVTVALLRTLGYTVYLKRKFNCFREREVREREMRERKKQKTEGTIVYP